MKRFVLACILAALLVAPAVAAWNLSLISGPWPVSGGVVFVIPADKLTPELQPYAEPVPAGVPVLAGVPCVALAFASEVAAKGPLATYWGS